MLRERIKTQRDQGDIPRSPMSWVRFQTGTEALWFQVLLARPGSLGLWISRSCGCLSGPFFSLVLFSALGLLFFQLVADSVPVETHSSEFSLCVSCLIQLMSCVVLAQWALLISNWAASPVSPPRPVYCGLSSGLLNDSCTDLWTLPLSKLLHPSFWT